MTDPSDFADPPAPTPDPLPALPPRLARLAEVATTGVPLTFADPYDMGFPDPSELPEVQGLVADGWRPLDGAPLHALLPAAWPREHRTWVPNRLPQVAIAGCTTDEYLSTVVPVDDDWEPDDDVDSDAHAAGLPAQPRGRIWLLRSPWPRIPVAAIYRLIGAPLEDGPGVSELMFEAAREVFTWDEERALAACPAKVRDLIDAWAAFGRVGEAASPFIERRLTPGKIAQLTGIGLDEPTAVAWYDSLHGDVDDDAIAFITAWRAARLPGDPPPGATRFTHRDLSELRDWLDAGFDLYAADRLELAGLARALEWREAGYDPADTYELLRSNPALTPAEARAFDAPTVRDRRREWIYLGFDAAQATAWTAAAIGPEEARLWRACGKQPADVASGQLLPPDLLAGRETLFVSRIGSRDGRAEYPQWDEIEDPPGTQGRRARRWAGDDDPWINED